MTQPNEDNPFHTPPELWEKLKPLALEMRHNPTPAEEKLWQSLRNRRVMGAKFRRQHSIERFIVDFVCLESRLIIEVDGPIHDTQQESDAVRQEFLTSQGFSVIRFSNEQILDDVDSALNDITVALSDSPPLLRSVPVRGQGGEGAVSRNECRSRVSDPKGGTRRGAGG